MGCLNYGLPAFGPLPIAFLLALDSARSTISAIVLTAVITAPLVAWVIASVIVCVSTLSAYAFHSASKILAYFILCDIFLLRIVFYF